MFVGVIYFARDRDFRMQSYECPLSVCLWYIDTQSGQRMARGYAGTGSGKEGGVSLLNPAVHAAG